MANAVADKTTKPIYTFASTMSEAELSAELKRVQADFAAGAVTFDTVAEMLDEYTKANTLRIRAEEQAKAKAAALGSFTIKVSEKGAVQMRGVPGTNVRFGFTVYASTLEFLYRDENRAKITAFIEANRKALSWGKQS